MKEVEQLEVKGKEHNPSWEEGCRKSYKMYKNIMKERDEANTARISEVVELKNLQNCLDTANQSIATLHEEKSEFDPTRAEE